MPKDDDPKPYYCEQCGYVLGLIRKGPDRRSKLDVFRLPLPTLAILVDSSSEYSYAVIELEQGNVPCGHCGAVRKWRISDHALDDLLARRKKRTFGLMEVEHG